MESPLQHGPKTIHSALAQVEEYDSPASSAPSTKVIQVTWVHSLSSTLGDGEWSVFWEGMDEGHGIDEGYGSLASGSEGQSVSLDESSRKEDTHPFEAMGDSFFEKIFQERAIVQTPTRIVPPLVSTSPNSPTTSSSQKFSVYFLLSNSTAVPTSVTIHFTPIWASPIAPSPTLTVTVNPVFKTVNYGSLHKAWAKTRLVDLNELQELADELARTGQRGVGIGSFKVGIDGGGHDEERLKWEAEMVGRERNWVLKTFLGKVIAGKPLKEDALTGTNGDDEDLTEQKEIEEGLKLLGTLAQGLKVTNDDDAFTEETQQAPGYPSTVKSASQAPPASNDNDGEEDDLFALPLSPRSPEICVSPFSFRGPAIGNLDATIWSGMPTKITAKLSADAIPVAGGAPLTPTLTGAPNPGEMRKKRLAGPGISA
ncbi:hypothetical protein L211DRAFT_379300 [Terfezia boudieri ATCC MYA-4762]|uniref:Uncharacterized protein n=1 Tax=Terfezia boudieri ATCC MYA-4762 TaxID=1051890 RepID=A0A3N4LZK4_9PEZI|nr:hypothetical protein L211DRAFT_379300 [Terfezia boudieri ATCC MYA-4762]